MLAGVDGDDAANHRSAGWMIFRGGGEERSGGRDGEVVGGYVGGEMTRSERDVGHRSGNAGEGQIDGGQRQPIVVASAGGNDCHGSTGGLGERGLPNDLIGGQIGIGGEINGVHRAVGRCGGVKRASNR